MRATLCFALLGVLASIVAGCGGSDDTSSSTTPPPAARAADFPSATGKTLTTLRRGLPSGIVLAPSTTASLTTGTARVAGALFTADKKFIGDAELALYTTDHDGTNVRGPYVATFESMAPKPQFQSRSTASDLAEARGIYVARVPIQRPGKRVITGVARIKGKLYQTSGFELPIARPGSPKAPPDVGQKAPTTHTLTLTDVNGDASKIDTRVPPAKDLLQSDLADVLGKKAVVLTFATPLLCQSRVCGPVVDVVEQVKNQTKGDVAFIHQEIYKDNEVSKGFRPQLGVYRLPTEPWTFVIDKSGKIAARFEGGIGVAELQRAVDKVAAGS